MTYSINQLSLGAFGNTGETSHIKELFLNVLWITGDKSHEIRQEGKSSGSKKSTHYSTAYR